MKSIKSILTESETLKTIEVLKHMGEDIGKFYELALEDVEYMMAQDDRDTNSQVYNEMLDATKKCIEAAKNLKF